MKTRGHRWWRITALGALAVFGFGACGGGADEDGTSAADRGEAPASAARAPEAQGSSAIPAVDVIDVSSGEEFALGGLVPSDRPLLIWFWAPH